MGFRRANGRVGTRNFLLIVPTSMCASHEAQQIAMMAEFSIYKRERFPNVDGAVPAAREVGPWQTGRALRHPGNRRHAGGHRARPPGGRGNAACCQRGDAHDGAHQRADPRGQVRRLRRVFRPFCEPGARSCGGSTHPAGGHRRHHGGSRILRRRAHSRAPRQGSGNRRGRVRDGRLVQGVRVQVRKRAGGESESRERRRRPAQHHDQVARRHRQGRHHARRGMLRVAGRQSGMRSRQS